MTRREKVETAALKTRVTELEQCLRALMGVVTPWLYLHPSLTLGMPGDWARRLLSEAKHDG